MDNRSNNLGEGNTARVAGLAGQSECLLEFLTGLVGVTQKTRDAGALGQAVNAWVKSQKGSVNLMLTRIIRSDRLLQMFVGGSHLTDKNQHISEDRMGRRLHF